MSEFNWKKLKHQNFSITLFNCNGLPIGKISNYKNFPFIGLITCSKSNSAQQDDLSELSCLTKKALNTLTAQRMVGMSEACHEIDKLDLTICSDSITHISMSQCLALKSRSENSKKTDLISVYRRRAREHIHYSLEEFFYAVYCRDHIEDNKKHRILMAGGLNCKPVYPADFYFARGMLLLHKPWHKNDPLDNLFKDRNKTIQTFLRMLDEPGAFPTSVRLQYDIARKYSQEAKIELIAKQGIVHNQELDEDAIDPDLLDEILEHEFCGHKTDDWKCDDMMDGVRVNIGREYDWTTPTFQEERLITDDGETYLTNLQERFYGANEKLEVQPRQKRNGDVYPLNEQIGDLNEEQRVIVFAAIDALMPL